MERNKVKAVTEWPELIMELMKGIAEVSGICEILSSLYKELYCVSTSPPQKANRKCYILHPPLSPLLSSRRF